MLVHMHTEASKAKALAIVEPDVDRRAKSATEHKALNRPGASGGLGTVLLQLLTSAHRGLHIVAVCSGSNASLVKRHGAAEVRNA